MSTIYEDKGYEGRYHYLRCMAEDYGVPIAIVYALADALGPSEDFDGLISELSDYDVRSRNSR